jgi:hypothetical protein
MQLAVARSKNRQDSKSSKIQQYVVRFKNGYRRDYIQVSRYLKFANMVQPCEHKFETNV